MQTRQALYLNHSCDLLAFEVSKMVFECEASIQFGSKVLRVWYLDLKFVASLVVANVKT